MPEIPPELRAQLSALSDAEWSALSVQVRAPDTAEQLRTALSKHIDGDRLEAVLRVANPTAFVDENGTVDEAKVAQSLGGLFGVTAPVGPRHANFGQYAQPPSTPAPGDSGAAEAARRFGGHQPAPAVGRGAAGAAEAAKRFRKDGA